VATFVLAHEFCEFEELMHSFCYLSPFDLCVILDSLEADEILVSQYFERRDASLFESCESVPVPGFEAPELFLWAMEMNGVHRVVRTTCDMFHNMCLLNNN
jgi:hypothetical protein